MTPIFNDIYQLQNIFLKKIFDMTISLDNELQASKIKQNILIINVSLFAFF